MYPDGSINSRDQKQGRAGALWANNTPLRVWEGEGQTPNERKSSCRKLGPCQEAMASLVRNGTQVKRKQGLRGERIRFVPEVGRRGRRLELEPVQSWT